MEGWESALTLGLVSGLAAVGLLAGLGRGRFPRAPLALVLLATAGYLSLLTITGIYVAACPGCTSHISYDSARWADLYSAFFWGTLFLVGIVGVTWFGTMLSSAFRRLTR